MQISPNMATPGSHMPNSITVEMVDFLNTWDDYEGNDQAIG